MPVPSSLPNGATYIYVTTSAGTSPATYFLVGQNPLLSTISPQLGPSGTPVTLTGQRFGTTQGSSTVNFGSTPATTITSWTDTQIVAQVPSAAPLGGTYISVTTSAGGSNSQYFTVGALPTINNVSPPLGPQGTSVTLTGTRFGATQSGGSVKFGSVAAPITNWSDTQIVASVPNTAPNGANYISVTTSVGTGNSVYFLVGQNPWLSNISSQSAPRGASITLTGQRFGATQGSSTVTFGSTVATSISTWTDTRIVAQVPNAAPSGTNFIQVSTSAGGSNLQYFSIPGPSITSLSPTSGSVGRSVTIAGSGFGATQGSSTVKFNGVAATNISAWSDTSITAKVPSGATTGNVVVTVSGAASNGSNLTVVAAPTIVASVFPPSNATGWNTTNVYVSFSCSPGAAPIATCPEQQVVSTDGANQVVTGTATDASGNSASASVTLNVERTPPAISVSSPADQDVFTSGTASIAGSVTNSVTDVNSVTCNGTTVATSAGAFSCNISLTPGVNLLMVRATDVAGNVSAVRLHVSYTAALPAPASLQIGPASANVLIGGTQQFTAVDQLGRPRTDATWNVDNTNLATITTDASPTLTGVAAGTVTLTAAVGGVSTQIQVNILAGASFPVGTVLWAAPSTPGFAVVQIAQAVSTTNGPDLYSIESASITSSQIRALTSDGRPMWTAPISGNAQQGLTATPDGSGGILVHLSPQAGLGSTIDLDGQSGAVAWQRNDSSGVAMNKFSVGQDGTVYFFDVSFTTDAQNSTTEHLSLTGIDPSSGATTLFYPVPLSTITNQNGTFVPDYRLGVLSRASNPIVGPDGSIFAQVLVIHEPVVNSSYNQTLSLLQASPSGATTLTTIAEVDWNGSGPIPNAFPGLQIPDGSGGIFASWGTTTGSALVNHISHITSAGITDSTPSFQNGISSMVLGESGTLFATDNGTVTSFTPALVINWSYSTSGLATMQRATVDGGLIISDSTQGIIQLDLSGHPSAAISSLLGTEPFDTGTFVSIGENDTVAWLGAVNGQAVDAAGPRTDISSSDFPATAGTPQKQGASPGKGTPTNYHQTSAESLPDGTLRFFYEWSSSTGKKEDLSRCKCGEQVTYPGAPEEFFYPLPMLGAINPNPTVNSFSATYLGSKDIHKLPPNGFVKPYIKSNFSAVQKYWWSCPYVNGGAMNFFLPDIDITRQTFLDSDGFWKYQVMKSNVTSTIRLPNQ